MIEISISAETAQAYRRDRATVAHWLKQHCVDQAQHALTNSTEYQAYTRALERIAQYNQRFEGYRTHCQG